MRPAMAEVINLRTRRKRNRRRQDEMRAAANRLIHGEPGHSHQRHAAEQDKRRRTLEQHHIEKGDDR
jgi:Domain of unknown function (DUF4169)